MIECRMRVTENVRIAAYELLGFIIGADWLWKMISSATLPVRTTSLRTVRLRAWHYVACSMIHVGQLGLRAPIYRYICFITEERDIHIIPSDLSLRDRVSYRRPICLAALEIFWLFSLRTIVKYVLSNCLMASRKDMLG
jgi:hypothetical protein